MRAPWCAVALMLTAPVNAGPVADSFKAGVLGLPWGSSQDEIASKLPGGSWKKIAGREFYEIKDARSVLGVERAAKNKLVLALTSDGRLNSISVYFPLDPETYVKLLNRAREQFGPAETRKPQSDGFRTRGPIEFSTNWPADEGITVRVVNNIAGISSTVFLLVENAEVSPRGSTGLE